jgi:glycosyltransferase involved in cell wall biosynthesis
MQAFVQAYHRLDYPILLVFLGVSRTKQPEELAREVLALGASTSLSHAIRWIPEVPYHDMPGVYALSDIVLTYPSIDAFPATLLAAAACGRPVITSDLPAYRHTFIQRACTLVPPNDPSALADAIVALVEAGPAAWASQANQARQDVLVDHEEAAQRLHLITLYDKLVGAGFPRMASSENPI